MRASCRLRSVGALGQLQRSLKTTRCGQATHRSTLALYRLVVVVPAGVQVRRALSHLASNAVNNQLAVCLGY
jgi:hypothetical protein